jgi:hypothetical protein
MEEKKFKLSVSDWELTFEDGEIVTAVTVMKETTTSNANGKASISLQNATFSTDIYSKFKDNVKVPDIKQNFVLLNGKNEIVSKEERHYPNMMIKMVGMSGEEGEPSIEKIVFSTVKER